jgi:NADH:ubiquinone reductase (H+-translocating)
MNAGEAPRVVVVGAGFGGLSAASTLAKGPVQVTVIDRKNHHTFQPLLYQVATAGLSAGDIASPIRSILRPHNNVEVLMSEVSGFDLERRVVTISESEVPYDYLVIAGGAGHSYFGHRDWEVLAPSLKTIEDALEIRRRILLAFELAERRAVAGLPSLPLNFVIVGAGPTGVELAGTLAEICRHALRHEFRTIDPAQSHIFLVEGGPRVLAAYPDDLSKSALEQLGRLGVDVRLSTMVEKIEPGAVYFGETRIDAAVILWAAGVAASPLARNLGVPVDRDGRVMVNPDLSVPHHPEVFVIGDMAALKDERGKLLPGVAQVALQEGRFVANVIRREASSGQWRQRIPGAGPRQEAVALAQPLASSAEAGNPNRAAFHYHDKGSLATIGRAAAVADIGKLHMSGYPAWLTWLFVHIFFLIGFRNRLLVLVQWAWAYVTYERGARLITGSTSLPGWNRESAASVANGSRPQENRATAAD